MILKIRHKGSWWLYGELKKIRYSLVTTTRTKFKDTDYDVYLVSLFDSDESDTEYEVQYYEICARDSDDNELVVAVDEVAFILNEDGKTVEKIAIVG